MSSKVVFRDQGNDRIAHEVDAAATGAFDDSVRNPEAGGHRVKDEEGRFPVAGLFIPVQSVKAFSSYPVLGKVLEQVQHAAPCRSVLPAKEV